ncbi:MAG: CHC2 zinc finger domain-containing protein [Verrucomicrobiales bacterium]|nr:hypothetical protein [Verrucomicrobiaceae bacterium]
MILQEELDRIKAEQSPVEVASRHNLEPRRQGSSWLALCPFHEEKTPSFNLYADHAYCYGCGWSGDSIALEAELSGLSFQDTCRKLGATESEMPEDKAKRLKSIEERRQRQEQAEAERRRENKAKRSSWPQLYVGRTHDLQEVATLRGIAYAGPWLAQELGHLRFARWRSQLAWLVGDRSAVAARRLDGKLWEHGAPHKSDTFPGSEKHPIGLTKSSLPVILIEGEADYLATLARLWQQGQHENWQVVCMLGASAKLSGHAARLTGREVVIYAHSGKAGRAASQRWKEEATLAGARSVTVYELPTDRDINDLTAEKEEAE